MQMIVIFDLDRTITRQPTWTRFLIFVNRGRATFWLLLLRILAQAVAYKLGLADRDSVKSVSLRALSHCSHEEAGKFADRFTLEEVRRGLRPGAVKAIEWHRLRGDRLVMATASVDLVAERMGAALGFDEVISTRLDWSDPDGRPVPRLAGLNCYGAEKLEEFARRGISRAGFAYSDHISDLDMLRMADHGVAVNPSHRLRKASADARLTIVDFNTPDISSLEMKAARTP